MESLLSTYYRGGSCGLMVGYLQVGWYKPAGGVAGRIVKGGKARRVARRERGGASAPGSIVLSLYQGGWLLYHSHQNRSDRRSLD